MARYESNSEKFITTAVITFINQNVQSATQLSTLDDIILNYVVTVLESLAKESLSDLRESFDVEEFCEMLTAYFPGFELIPHSVVTQWILDLVDGIRKEFEDHKPKNVYAFDSFLSDLDSNDSLIRSKRHSESSSESSGSTNSSGKPTSSRVSRSPKISETSDCGDIDSDVSYIINRLQACQFQSDDNIQVLLEMFPTLDKVDAQHFLATTNGDLEKSVQLALLQQENEDDDTPSATSKKHIGLAIPDPIPWTKGTDGDEKAMKQRIVARYGFIDQEEDKKEFRPPPLKVEPKKLLRYRESQVVSTKGERFSEVKCGANGGEIKNYIYKPPKPY